MGTLGNMARSLLVVLALVAALVAIVPRGEGSIRPPVDAGAVAAQAVKDSGMPFELPVGLPDGWTATTARYAPSADSRPTWQAVWTTPTGQSISLKQTWAATAKWLDMATNQGTSAGQVDLAGRTWERRSDARGQVALVSATPLGLTTVVSSTGGGTSGMDEVAQFVDALQPAARAS